MEKFDLQAVRSQAKALYIRESIPDCLKYANETLLKGARESGDQFNVLEALIVLARFELEFGMFRDGDIHLNEVSEILKNNHDSLSKADPSKYFHYQCKYYHL